MLILQIKCKLAIQLIKLSDTIDFQFFIEFWILLLLIHFIYSISIRSSKKLSYFQLRMLFMRSFAKNSSSFSKQLMNFLPRACNLNKIMSKLDLKRREFEHDVYTKESRIRRVNQNIQVTLDLTVLYATCPYAIRWAAAAGRNCILLKIINWLLINWIVNRIQLSNE